MIKLKDLDSSLTEREIESIIVNLATGFIRDGFLSHVGKSREQFIAEFRTLTRNLEELPIVDHTEEILEQARAYRKGGNENFACLFYAMWFEHTINRFIYSFAKRMNLPDMEIGEIIRATSYKSKCSWLLRIFNKKPFKGLHINLLIKLMDVRNSFVHYKWKVTNEQTNKEIRVILSNIEKTVRYVRGYENKYVLGISRREVKKKIQRGQNTE